MKAFGIFFFLVVILSSCNSKCKEEVDLNNSEVSFKFERLEEGLFNAKSEQETRRFIDQHTLFTQKYLGIPKVDPQVASNLFNFYSNSSLREFYLDGEKKNDGFKELRQEFENLFRHIKYYYPKYHVPDVNTIVSGLSNNEFVLDDSLFVISVDFFYGKDAKYRPEAYEYMLRRYQREYIVPLVTFTLGVSAKFNNVNTEDPTMLAEMVNFGKAHYFMQRMLPCAPDSMIIMYSDQQLKDVENNINIIWGHFVERKLLFETKAFVIQKYVGESPKINEIGEKCPGRIGRYLGWQIVRKYMEENPDITLQQLMAEKNALKIFNLSKYKPAMED